MKRSEMVNRLMATILDLSPEMTFEEQADEILGVIEAAGMLPPTIMFHATGEYEEFNKIKFELLEGFDADFEWEEE